MPINIKNYLRRISFHEEIQLNHNTLAQLHRRHIQSVPFENLDIHLGKEIHLDLIKIEDKIIKNNRGGFCYELNSLFGTLLRQLDFDVKMISARVFEREKFGQEFDHLVLIVNLGEEWLVDVGFGDSFLEPLKIKTGMKQQDPAGIFRIERQDTKYFRLEVDKKNLGYTPKFLFSLLERQFDEFGKMCEYHQTSPQSSFTREKVCSLATENGRITLRDQSYIT